MPGPAPTYRSWQPGIIPLRPLTFGDFLAAPFRAMRFNRAVVLGGPLLVAVVTSLVTAVAMWVVLQDGWIGAIDATGALSDAALSPAALSGLVLTAVLGVLGEAIAAGLVIPGTARAVLGERLTLAGAWAQLRPRLGAVLLLWLLLAGAVTAVAAVAAIPFIAATVGGNLGAVLGTYLLLLAVLVPVALLAALAGGIARAVVVLEGLGPIAALTRVRALIRGRFWWTVLIVFVATLLISVAASLIQQVIGIGAVLGMMASPQQEIVTFLIFVVLTMLALTIATTLTYAYLGALYPLLYIDLRIRHEGFDVTLAEAAEARQRQ